MTIGPPPSVIAPLREERRRLTLALEATPEFKRLTAINEAINRVLHAYGADADEIPVEVGGGQVRRERSISPEPSGTTRDAAYEVLRLKDSHGPLPTRDLLRRLQQRGHEVSGTNPANNLSAQLSRDSRFVSFGKSGWDLRQSITFDPAKLLEIVDSCWKELDGFDRESLRRYIDNAHTGLPPDIDAKLLTRARSQFERNLTNEEMAEVRNEMRSRSVSGAL